jgi:hypothetical protein
MWLGWKSFSVFCVMEGVAVATCTPANQTTHLKLRSIPGLYVTLVNRLLWLVGEQIVYSAGSTRRSTVAIQRLRSIRRYALNHSRVGVLYRRPVSIYHIVPRVFMNKMKAETGIDRQDIEHVQFSSRFVHIFMNRHGRGCERRKYRLSWISTTKWPLSLTPSICHRPHVNTTWQTVCQTVWLWSRKING